MLEKLLAKRHIGQLELASIRLKLILKLGWSSEKAHQVELEYRRFLYALSHKREEDVISPPSTDVDEFWHEHILDTRKYRRDCELIFGHYVDHTPGLSAENQSRADATRRRIYTENHIDSVEFNSGNRGSSGSSDGAPSSNTSPDLTSSCSGGWSGSGGGAAHHSHTGHDHSGSAADGGHSSSGHAGDASGHGGGDSGGGHGGGDSGGGDGGSGDGGGGCGGGSGCGGGGCGS